MSTRANAGGPKSIFPILCKMLEAKRYVSAETKDERERRTIPGQVYHRIGREQRKPFVVGQLVLYTTDFPRLRNRPRPGLASSIIDASE